MSLSIMRQVERMRVRWPDFQVAERNRSFACWEGPLRPLSQRYRVRISLQRQRRRGQGEDVLQSRIQVLDPLLRRREEGQRREIPHVYRNTEDPERPRLCLFDPETNEWHARCVVADTIVPWTIDWLASYEGWLATGRWVGGGRHPDGTVDA